MKDARFVTRYKTNSLLLPSLPSPSSPLTEMPPVFGVRAYRRGEGSCSHASGDYLAPQSPHEATAPGGAVRVAERPGGTQAPEIETNGMQGPLISFCSLCGREFEPQKTRRGQPKRFCSDACQARAWRRRDAAQNTQDSQKFKVVGCVLAVQRPALPVGRSAPAACCCYAGLVCGAAASVQACA